jgi:hypothetical protein
MDHEVTGLKIKSAKPTGRKSRNARRIFILVIVSIVILFILLDVAPLAFLFSRMAFALEGRRMLVSKCWLII